MPEIMNSDEFIAKMLHFIPIPSPTPSSFSTFRYSIHEYLSRLYIIFLR